jgi:hypothetical protein
MEEDFARRAAAEEEARRAAYEAEVASGKLATVRQIVSGEVTVGRSGDGGSMSPARSRSPGGCGGGGPGGGGARAASAGALHKHDVCLLARAPLSRATPMPLNT